MRIYRLLIISGHVMSWAFAWTAKSLIIFMELSA